MQAIENMLDALYYQRKDTRVIFLGCQALKHEFGANVLYEDLNTFRVGMNTWLNSEKHMPFQTSFLTNEIVEYLTEKNFTL